MILLGNLPSKRYVSKIYTDTLNVIYEDGTINRTKRKLKLLGNSVTTTKMSEVHMVAGRQVVLHNASSLPALKELFLKDFPQKDLKYASPYLSYIWARAFSGFNHTDVIEWVDTVRLFGKLHNLYYKPSVQPELHTKAIRDASKLMFVAADYPLIDTNNTIYKRWDKYTRQSVLESCAISKVSLYMDLLKAPNKSHMPIFRDKLDLQTWAKYSNHDRTEAVLERVYADIANELIFRQKPIHNIEYTIMETIMKIANSDTDAFFTTYVRLNFDKIMSEADLGVDEWLEWAMANKEFEPVT